MKKYLSVLLVLSLLLCGCSQLVPPKTTMPPETEPTTEATEPTTEPTTAPTTEPAPGYPNPPSADGPDAPYTGRVFAVTISNIRDALPHYGTMDAEILMEMWVNGSIVRDLALFTDPSKAEAIGSVRSDRLMFNDIALHYDAIVLDAAGSDQVIGNANALGVNRVNIDTQDSTYYSFRNKDRAFTFTPQSKWEHCLFAKGEGLVQLAQDKGFVTSQPEDKDYRLRFTEDGTPAAGESAENITVTFTYRNNKKDTSMVYDAALGKYVYHQYGEQMTVGDTTDPECFRNVIVMLADISMNNIYYTADFVKGGEGFFACGGKLIPIVWGADDENSPFWFETTDGQPLQLGVGNTYIAIAPIGSEVVYE